MITGSIQFLKSYILTSRRKGFCTRNQAKEAWKRVNQLNPNGDIGEFVIFLLIEMPLYGKALPYETILEGFVKSEEGVAV